MDASNRIIRINFVCHGNICRSPMAEFIFKDKINSQGLNDRFYVESSAVSTEEIGNSIYPPAKRCLNAHDIPFDKNKTARQITPADYDRFDLIIYMDRMNLRWLRYIIPDDPQDKIKLMMSFTGSNRDVADPWYTGDFETTFRDITEASRMLLRNII